MEIKKYQKAFGLLIPKKPFSRIVRETMTMLKPSVEWRYVAAE
jgi:histone H3/H4